MKRRGDLGSVLLLTALPAILYAPFLFGGKVLYWGVYLLQFFPWRQLAVEQIRAGQWPLWNPYLGAGTPLAANLQTAAFYPLNVLFLLMPVERAFGWELALHVALAGVFAYILGRTLGLGPFGALVSGLAYGLGGYVVAHWVFPSMVYAAAWLPLLLALAEKMQEAGGRRQPAEKLVGRTAATQAGAGSSPASQSEAPTKRTAGPIFWAALLALAIALQLLAGHAQTSFYSLVIVGLFVVWRATTQVQRMGTAMDEHSQTGPISEIGPVSRAWPILRAGGSFCLAVLWGLALAAIQLLPTAELAAHSQRAGNLTDLQFAYELSFWPWRLITLLAPDFFGNPARGGYWAFGTYWEEAAYVGILPLLLAGLAIFAWRRGRKRAEPGRAAPVPFFGLLSLLSLLLALGNHTPFYPLLFRYVPGFGLFQAPARLVIGYALSVAMLAGIGADSLRLTVRSRAVLRVLLVAGLGVLLAGAATRLALPAIRPSFADSALRLGLALALAAGLLLTRGRLRTARWQAAVLVLVAADLLAFGWGLAPGTDPQVYRAPTGAAQFLQSLPPGRIWAAEPYSQQVYDRYVPLDRLGPGDATDIQGLWESLIPNLNAVSHLPGLGNYDPLAVGLYRDLYDTIEGPPGAPPRLEQIRPLLNLFGVRYIVTDEMLDLPLLYDAGPRIYYNDQALPEAFFVPRARAVEDKEERLAALLDPAFDPRAEVLLSTQPATALPTGQATGEPPSQPELVLLRKTANRVIMQISTNQAGTLVWTDTYYPGWQATMDGKAVEILTADQAFCAVALNPGEHTVIFDYEPISFRLGAWLTLSASLFLIALLIRSGFTARNRTNRIGPLGD